MQRAKHYAEISAVVFILLALVTLLMFVIAPARGFFLGQIHTAPVLLVIAAFASAGAGMFTRHEWGYYWALAVAVGFCAGGFTQLAAMERSGIATLLVGGMLLLSLKRASRWFPPSRFAHPWLFERRDGDERYMGDYDARAV